MELPLQQGRGDVGVPGGQDGGDAAAAHHPQGVVHILRGLVLHGEHRRQLPVHGQKHAGPQVDAGGQPHLHLPHEGRGAHHHGLSPDGAGPAALLVKAEVVHLLIAAVLAPQQPVEEPLEAAVRRPGHGRGVGRHLGHILAEDLHAVELDGPRREQVPVGHHHGPAAADPLRAPPARHGAAGLVEPPGQAGKGQSPAQGQGKGRPRPQDGGPVQQEVLPPPQPQGAEAGKHQGGHQHHRRQGRLPYGGAVLLQGSGVEAPDRARLFAGAPVRLRHQIGGLVIGGGHAEGVPQAPALPGAAPHGERHGKAAHRRVAGDGAAPRQQQPGAAVRRHGRQGHRRQQVGSAAPVRQLPDGSGDHMPAQEGHRRQTRQHHAALEGRVPGPPGDLPAVGLQRHGDCRQQRRQHRRRQGGAAPLRLRPILRRRLRQRRLRADGLDLRQLLRLGLRRVIELLRLHQPLPGEQAPPGPQQRLPALLHHRIHGAAHHILQGDGPGRPGQLLLTGLLPARLRRGGGLCPRRGGRASLRRGSPLPPRPGSGWALRRRCGLLRPRRVRGGLPGGLLPQDLLLHGLHQPLLPAGAVLRQDLLQREGLLRRRDVRLPRDAAGHIQLSLVSGSHAVPLLLSAAGRSLSPAAGAPPRTAGSPPPRMRSGNSASPAWGCSPENHSSPWPGGSCRPPRCR